MINVIKSYLVLSNLLVQINHMFFPWKSAQSVLCNIYHLIFLIKHNAQTSSIRAFIVKQLGLGLEFGMGIGIESYLQSQEMTV